MCYEAKENRTLWGAKNLKIKKTCKSQNIETTKTTDNVTEFALNIVTREICTVVQYAIRIYDVALGCHYPNAIS